MKNDFDTVIGRIGGEAVLPWLDNATVTVSIQPDGFLGDMREEAGAGAVCRYKFFTPFNATTELIGEGSELVFQGHRYMVESITTAYMGNRAVYRRGTLLLETEAGHE